MAKWESVGSITDWNTIEGTIAEPTVKFTVAIGIANNSPNKYVEFITPTNPEFNGIFQNLPPADILSWNITSVQVYISDTPGGLPLNSFTTDMTEFGGFRAGFFLAGNSGDSDWPPGRYPLLLPSTTYYLCFETVKQKGKAPLNSGNFLVRAGATKPAYLEVPPPPPPEPPPPEPPTEPPTEPPPSTGGGNNDPDQDEDPDAETPVLQDPEVQDPIAQTNQVVLPADKAVANTATDKAARVLEKNVFPELGSGIPEPRADAESLYRTVQQLKIQFEQLTRQRGNRSRSAVIVEELNDIVEAVVRELDKRYATDFQPVEIPDGAGTVTVANSSDIVNAFSAHVQRTDIHFTEPPNYGVWGRRRGTWIRSVSFQDLEDAIDEIDLSNVDTGGTSLVDDPDPALGGYLNINGTGFEATFVAQVAINEGELCFLNANGRMEQADATQASTSKTLLGIAITNIPAGASGDFLLQGYFPVSGLTTGDVMYVSMTAGEITNAPPTAGTTGAVVRPVGTALTTAELFFNPDRTWIVLS